ncbi:MAG: hypothetical protein H6739_27240 [Alphaproteobacteria bacterium]|nr:hypothetical protein [Alphaproteobacteria bacterium]
MTRTPFLMATLGLLLAGTACDGDSGDKDGTTTDDTNTSTTDDTSDTEDTEPPIPTNETDCNDGVDEDEDGVTDCEDDDCAAEFRCTWPTSLTHRTQADFEGSRISCWFGGYDVPDCQTILSASLTEFEGEGDCDACDKTFSGPFIVDRDECSELTGSEEPPPTTAWFGFRFVSPQERVLYARDESGVWSEAVSMSQDNEGRWTWQYDETLRDRIDECSSDTQDLGVLHFTISFNDTP